MNSEKKWYAIYTKPRWEKKVAEMLVKRKVDVFCPLNKVMRQWADRKKIVFEPLFTSYVFVCVNETDHLTVRQTDGVINFVYWLGSPAIIKDDEIDTIKNFLNDYSNVKLEKIKVNIYDKIRITEGPFVQQEGNVLEVKNRTVKVFLPSLGYNMTAEVSKSKIEVLSYPKGAYTTKNLYTAKTG